MSGNGKDREARERTRAYQARQAFHNDGRRRRIRDNLIAGIGGGILVVGLVVAQTLYFTSGPGAPAPEPTPTSTPTPSLTPAPEPSGSGTPSPSPSL